MNDRPQTRKHTRHERIIALLRANPAVRVADLAREFGVSTETVRRDLDELSRVGAVNRTYGGAARSSMGHEAAVNERLQEHVGERERIAQRASTLVESGDLVMIDGGSTTIHFARQLAAQSCRVTALTNSLGVAAALGRDPSSKVVLCPGDYHPSEGIVTGPETIAFLERFFVDKAFIGASGLTEAGPSEVHSSAAWVKRRMLRQAKRCYLLLDSSKFNVLRHELVCPLGEISELITDRRPSGALRAALTKAAVKIDVVSH
ncbi:MAG TPA: DeoR/GlpR family DNA-binding transcription regulator [Kiloniellales bacterium]